MDQLYRLHPVDDDGLATVVDVEPVDDDEAPRESTQILTMSLRPPADPKVDSARTIVANAAVIELVSNVGFHRAFMLLWTEPDHLNALDRFIEMLVAANLFGLVLDGLVLDEAE